MIKRSISLLLVTVILVALFPVVAASSDTYSSGDLTSVDVIFEIVPDVAEPPTEPSFSNEPSATYTIIIPATINLEESER